MNKNDLAPICLFTYNRLDETKQTIKALQKNHLASESELFIFSDGSKSIEGKSKIEEVRKFIRTVVGFKNVTIYESEENKGLANSIIKGVGLIFERFNKVIVLEDDLKTTTNFLDFMNQSLSFYKDDARVQSVSGYSLKIPDNEKKMDVYLHRRTHSWSWGTWKNCWKESIFDKQKLQEELNTQILDGFKKECGEDIPRMLTNSIEGKNDSWYVRWAYDHYKNGAFCVYPYLSKVQNIGFSEEGTNCNGIDVSLSEMDTSQKRKFVLADIVYTKQMKKSFLTYFSKKYKIKFRIKLLLTAKGRESIAMELKRRFL